jgi:hypothetical protein
MSWHLSIPPRAGCRKLQHRTERAARQQLLSLRARNLVFDSGRAGRELHVYRCDDCGFYHVGHGKAGEGEK